MGPVLLGSECAVSSPPPPVAPQSPPTPPTSGTRDTPAASLQQALGHAHTPSTRPLLISVSLGKEPIHRYCQFPSSLLPNFKTFLSDLTSRQWRTTAIQLEFAQIYFKPQAGAGKILRPSVEQTLATIVRFLGFSEQ